MHRLHLHKLATAPLGTSLFSLHAYSTASQQLRPLIKLPMVPLLLAVFSFLSIPHILSLHLLYYILTFKQPPTCLPRRVRGFQDCVCNGVQGTAPPPPPWR